MSQKLLGITFKAAFQTMINGLPGLRDTFSGKPERKYAVIQAHPDDEILIAGLIQRTAKYTKNPQYLILTDGNGNTTQDRQAEVKESFEYLTETTEHAPEILMPESDLLELLTTPQGESSRVPDKNIKEAAKRIIRQVNYLEEKLREAEVNTVLTDDFNGGHFIHDITQMVANIVIRRIVKNKGAKSIELYEFPQYFMRFKTDTLPSSREIRAKLGEAEALRVAGDLEGFRKMQKEIAKSAEYVVGEFLPRDSMGLEDPAIGMKQGVISLTPAEMKKKIESRRFHKSQNNSTSRLIEYAVFPKDLSVERARLIDIYRDYSQRPNKHALLYECIPWRAQAIFETFSRLYKTIVRKEEKSPRK